MIIEYKTHCKYIVVFLFLISNFFCSKNLQPENDMDIDSEKFEIEMEKLNIDNIFSKSNFYHTFYKKFNFCKLDSQDSELFLCEIKNLYNDYEEDISQENIIDNQESIYTPFYALKQHEINVYKVNNLFKNINVFSKFSNKFILSPFDKIFLVDLDCILKFNRNWIRIRSKMTPKKKYKIKYPTQFPTDRYTNFEYNFFKIFLNKLSLIHILKISIIFDGKLFLDYIPIKEEIAKILEMKSLTDLPGFIKQKIDYTEITFYKTYKECLPIHKIFKDKYIMFYPKNNSNHQYQLIKFYSRLYIGYDIPKNIIFLINRYYNPEIEIYFYKLSQLNKIIKNIKINESLKFPCVIEPNKEHNSSSYFEIKIESEFALLYPNYNNVSFLYYYNLFQ